VSTTRRKTRRGFFKLCSAVLAASVNPHLLAAQRSIVRRYPRTCLVDPQGNLLSLGQLEEGIGYVFAYPYRTTPCFLIDLGTATGEAVELTTESGQPYRWEGGVGAKGSVVAFSAICAHKLSHPARSISFINYRHETVDFRNTAEARERRSRVIYCCSENSVYDPAQGARVLGGPAPQPLATVLLEHDPTRDCVFATGTLGGEKFEEYFDKFAFRLSLEFRTDDIRTPVGATTAVVPISEFSKNQRLCG